MDIITFNAITSSRRAARRYLLGFCWKNHQRHCPRCRERKLYKVAGGRRRCARCNYTFHDFSQRFVNGCAFSPQQWLWFLKLFEMDVENQEIAAQLDVSYATVLKAKDVLRRAILARAPDAAEYYARGFWPGPGRPQPAEAMADSPVFGVVDINGYILCDVLPGLDAESLLHFKLHFHLKTASIGHVVYTAPYRNYLTLICCGPALWPTRTVAHNDPRLPANGLDFWIYARQRLKRLRGVTPAQFPLHLKEWELRYNHRDQDLLPVIASALCGFVPRAAPPESPPAPRPAPRRARP
ncbi:MAG: transposase [Desulfovibrionaceae bacterium]|jgi:transposase|nr:transposase [Desulfovibrionaceae bacterium]